MLVATALLSVACGGGGQQMHERPRSAASNAGEQPRTTSTTPARPYVAPVIPKIVVEDTQPVTPKTYAAAAPQKPKITGLSEEELSKCEAGLPSLDTCKPAKSIADGQQAVVDEVRACVARYVSALDGCLCKAGSQPHCKYAEDQKREIGKMPATP
jgi:hypothetical protein